MTASVEHQTWSSNVYQSNAGFVPILGAAFTEWLNPRRGKRILDLSCVDGVPTAGLTAAGADVVEVDASRDSVESAQALGLDAVVDAVNEAFSFAETLLAPSLRDQCGGWTADYMRIRVEAHAV